jgi:hypothetical protein
MTKRKDYEGTVEIEHEGKKYKGRYVIEKSLVTVFYGASRKQSTQIGGGSAESLARLMLREFVQADPEPW